MSSKGDDRTTSSTGKTKDTRVLPRAVTVTAPDIDEDTRRQVETGVASTVDRARVKGSQSDVNVDGGEGDEEEGEGRYVAIKAAAGRKRFSPEPHDILKEIAILSELDDANVIHFLGYRRDRHSDLIELYTPWIPYALEDLLDSPSFTPSPYPPQIKHLVLPLPPSPTTTSYRSPTTSDLPQRTALFVLLSKSIAYQTARALAYLHSALSPPIAHRDLKPRNLLLTRTGRVQLIDFGIAYHRDLCAAPDNLWPESEDGMYNDVATGPFRAPELIFGPTTYNAPATDLWSLGATLAHFFTSLQLHRKSYGSDSSSLSSGADQEENDNDDDEDDSSRAYVLPKDADGITFRSAEWVRAPLFEAHKGSIGLAWSIFSTLGTPDAVNWPGFASLPDANKLTFKSVPPIDLRTRLPNLPPGVRSARPSTTTALLNSKDGSKQPQKEQEATPLDLIRRLIVYPPEERLRATEVLAHPWFAETGDGEGDGDDENYSGAVPLLLPTDLPLDDGVERDDSAAARRRTSWHDKDLGHWLDIAFKSRR